MPAAGAAPRDDRQPPVAMGVHRMDGRAGPRAGVTVERLLVQRGAWAVLRRWCVHGEARAELVFAGLPTDRERADFRRELLFLRADVLRELTESGMRVWATERKHDDDRHSQTIIDRLKRNSRLG